MRAELGQARSERKRDPNPRFALLRALRALADRREHLLYAQRVQQLEPTEPVSEGGVWSTFHGAGTTALMELKLPELDDDDTYAPTDSSSNRPGWANWWPSPKTGACDLSLEPAASWASQQVVAVRKGWDGRLEFV